MPDSPRPGAQSPQRTPRGSPGSRPNSMRASPRRKRNAGSASGNVKVVVRFRPLNALERGQEQVPEWLEFPDGQTVDTREDGLKRRTFTFDRIFQGDASQEAVFAEVGAVVEDTLAGYNGTVLAYGQTSSGKTHTMEGPDIDDAAQRGVIPRVADAMFGAIPAASEQTDADFSVSVTMVEIYMERIRDLLGPGDNLKVREDPKLGVSVAGAAELEVHSRAGVMEALRTGQQSRQVGATAMNEASSRSHSIFTLTCKQRRRDTGSVRLGKLHLVDLAGSEKVRRTGASGQRLDEAKTINRSLTTLGMVINALTDEAATHVPYRDSKLTRMLQEALGGNSRTTLIVNCSPSHGNAQETLSTLRFGSRAKTVRNNARVNEEMSAAELKQLLARALAENERLKAEVGGGGGGGPAEAVEEEQQRREEAERRLLEMRAQMEQQAAAAAELQAKLDALEQAQRALSLPEPPADGIVEAPGGGVDAETASVLELMQSLGFVAAGLSPLEQLRSLCQQGVGSPAEQAFLRRKLSGLSGQHVEAMAAATAAAAAAAAAEAEAEAQMTAEEEAEAAETRRPRLLSEALADEETEVRSELQRVQSSCSGTTAAVAEMEQQLAELREQHARDLEALQAQHRQEVEAARDEGAAAAAAAAAAEAAAAGASAGDAQEVHDGTLSLAFRELLAVPAAMARAYGPTVHTLDLSSTGICAWDHLDAFTALQTLVLDSNYLEELEGCPPLPTLTALSFNDNKVSSLPAFFDSVEGCLPRLQFLSMMRNPVAPDIVDEDELSDAERRYHTKVQRRYRLYIAFRCPGLRFLDASEISDAERDDARVNGEFVLGRRASMDPEMAAAAMAAAAAAAAQDAPESDGGFDLLGWMGLGGGSPPDEEEEEEAEEEKASAPEDEGAAVPVPDGILDWIGSAFK